MIEIPRSELKELRHAQAVLQALEANGVDNWEWYDTAMESLEALGDEGVPDLTRVNIGWVVMKDGSPIKTAATSPGCKSAKVYAKIGNAKAVARANDGTVCPAFVEVNPE